MFISMIRKQLLQHNIGIIGDFKWIIIIVFLIAESTPMLSQGILETDNRNIIKGDSIESVVPFGTTGIYEGMRDGVTVSFPNDNPSYGNTMISLPDFRFRHLLPPDTLAFNNIFFTGLHANVEYFGLMDNSLTRLQFGYASGKMAVSADLMANRYYINRITHTQYGIAANMSYRFSPNLSMVLFGQYFTSNPYFFMASVPYIPTTSYGGYLTIENKKVGINLGVQHRYNAYTGQMEVVPIINPTFRISSKVVMEVPLGDLVRDLFIHVVDRK